MALGEITDEIREVWLLANTNDAGGYQFRLADALRDQLAAKLKAEFLHEHDECELIRGSSTHVHCSQCGNINLDPRHNYDDSAWRSEAERRLTKGD